MSEVVPPVTDEGLRDSIRKWGDTARDYPRAATLHQLISEQAARTPESRAVVFEDQSLSYGDLERRSNRLAHHLRARGLRPNQLVALSLERSLDMTIGLLGILKAGGAYIPLDPAYPAERIAYMIEDSQTQIILTQESLLGALPASGAQVLCLDRDWPVIAEQPDDALTPSAGAEDLA